MKKGSPEALFGAPESVRTEISYALQLIKADRLWFAEEENADLQPEHPWFINVTENILENIECDEAAGEEDAKEGLDDLESAGLLP
jgi:hypothetical protein